MAHFPVPVHAGATANVMAMIAVTWLLVPRYPQIFAPAIWIAIVLTLNLLPVVLLRLGLRAETRYSTLAEMDFFRDQHKFSDWVYLAASADMAFWILVSWSVFSVEPTAGRLAAMLMLAFFVTFSPVLLRLFARIRGASTSTI